MTVLFTVVRLKGEVYMLEGAVRSNYARLLSFMLVAIFVLVSNVASITVDFAETTSSGNTVSSVEYSSDGSSHDESTSISPSEWLASIGALDEGIHIRYDNPTGLNLYGDYVVKPNPDDFTLDSEAYIEIAVTPDGKKWYLGNPWSSSWDSSNKPTDGSIVNVPPPILNDDTTSDNGYNIHIQVPVGEPTENLANIEPSKSKERIRNDIVHSAREYLGSSYSQNEKLRYGDTDNPKYFDCSGLVWRVRYDNGFNDLTKKGITTYKLVDKLEKTSSGYLKQGDIVFFNMGGTNDHCGIVTEVDLNGNVKKFVHATSEKNNPNAVKEIDINSKNAKAYGWAKKISCYRTPFLKSD